MSEFKLDMPEITADNSRSGFDASLGIAPGRDKIINTAVKLYVADHVQIIKEGAIINIDVPAMLRALAEVAISQGELMMLGFIAAKLTTDLTHLAQRKGKDLSDSPHADLLAEILDALKSK